MSVRDLTLNLIDTMKTSTSQDTINSWILRAQAGDQSAKELIADQFRALVAKYARAHMRAGTTIEDLMQDGYIGLFNAVNRFDPNEGNKFITYASYYVFQAVNMSATTQPYHIKIPISTLKKRTKIQKAIREFSAKYGRKPTVDELVMLTDFPEETINDLLSLQTETISADSYVEGTDVRIVDMIPAEEKHEEDIESQDFVNYISKHVERLQEHHKIVVVMLYGLDGKGVRNKSQVARELKLSVEGIRNREITAMKILRKFLDAPT